MKLVTVKMPEIYVEGIDELVRNGRYSSRSEVIRTAIRDLLMRELWDIKVFSPSKIAERDEHLVVKKVEIA